MKIKSILFKSFCFYLLAFLLSCNSRNGQTPSDSHMKYRTKEAAGLQIKLARGWNTWYNSSVLTHVLLPDGLAINLWLKDGRSGEILSKALIGMEDSASGERIIPGPRSYDGSYTELELKWKNIHVRVQSAASENNLYLLITPLRASRNDSLIIVPEMLWNRKGTITADQNKMIAETSLHKIRLYVRGDQPAKFSDRIEIPLNRVISLSSKKAKSAEKIEKILERARARLPDGKLLCPESPELYEALHAVLAWNTIYDPANNRVITPVSRIWSEQAGGWVLFCWDTYFAAYMLSLDSRELACANAVAITKEITEKGFIPNNSQPGHKSEDRSQPPVGSLVIKEIYRKYREKWFLEEVFEELLRWNRWRATNRDIDGYLVYGSDPVDYGENQYHSAREAGKIQAAKWESGLDNSPMWDEAFFDEKSHRLLLADVGLISLYITDCLALSEIASVLDKTEIAKELIQRAEKYSQKLQNLWDDKFGLYLNKDLVTGKFSYRLSPTLFYPLLARVPTQEQAERMIKEHFCNTEEFWGEYVLPSIARNDPAFKDNHYWRGRIWAPLNFLVYLGLRNYDLPQAQKDLVEKSSNLLLKSWREERHVYENYSAETGRGDDEAKKWSDPFYHWGALLGFLALIENGNVENTSKQLQEK